MAEYPPKLNANFQAATGHIYPSGHELVAATAQFVAEH